MALRTILLFSISWSAALYEGLGLPVRGSPDISDPQHPHRVRTKRCSCNNQLDSECHYFCHLDIIWVNTPSKMTVYGLGSPLARRRRSTGRCFCANTADRTCNSFCLHSFQDHSEHPKPDLQTVSQAVDSPDPVLIMEESQDDAHVDVLTFLRNLIREKHRAAGSSLHKPGYS